MKPKDPIWNFYIVSGEGKTLKTTCKECKKDISAKSDRMKAHREKCPSLAPTLSKKRPLQAPEITELCSTVTPSKKQRLTQPSVSSYGVATSSSDKDQLDLQIAKLFFACNIPFNVAEHAVFKDTIEMLRPGYSAPNRKDIGGSLLDSVHDKLLTNMKTELAGKDVVMMQDGWSDIHNHPVIATSLHTDGTAYFLSALDTGANKKNASYCTDVAHDAIKEAESFGCHVTGVVTDNEKKMEVMKKNLKESDPNLTVYN